MPHDPQGRHQRDRRSTATLHYDGPIADEFSTISFDVRADDVGAAAALIKKEWTDRGWSYAMVARDGEYTRFVELQTGETNAPRPRPPQGSGGVVVRGRGRP